MMTSFNVFRWLYFTSCYQFKLKDEFNSSGVVATVHSVLILCLVFSFVFFWNNGENLLAQLFSEFFIISLLITFILFELLYFFLKYTYQKVIFKEMSKTKGVRIN